MIVLQNGSYDLDGIIKTPGRVFITPKEVESLGNKIGNDSKINCIKAARDKWGLGLRDAKELIETVIKPRRRHLQVWHREVFDTLDDAWIPDHTPDGFQLVDVRVLPNG